MRRTIRLAILGAGSAQFSLALVRDVLLSEPLSGSVLALMDVSDDRLSMIAELTRRLVHETGGSLTIESTTDLSEALAGADFVINTALQGGHAAYESERAMAGRFGYYRGLTPLHVQRNLLLMLQVVRQMELLCPDAWLVQVSNPVFEGCTLLTRESRVKTVGLCHGYRGYRKVARLLGVDPERVTWDAPGFNHVIFLRELRVDGESMYPLLDRWIEKSAEEHWSQPDLRFDDTDLSRAAIDLYHRVGLLPLGDASRGFESWWYHCDLPTEQYWFGALGGFDSEPGWSAYLRHLGEGLEVIRSAVTDHSTPVTERLPLTPSGENHIPLIESLLTDEEKVFQVNLPNSGAIAGIPDDVVVEAKGLVHNGRIELVGVGTLPGPLMTRIMWPRWALLEQIVEGLRRHDLGQLREVMLADPRTRSVDQVDGLLSEALATPYNSEVAKWYGWTNP